MLIQLSVVSEKGTHIENVVYRAWAKFVGIWEDVTSYEKRNAPIKGLQHRTNHKDVSNTISNQHGLMCHFTFKASHHILVQSQAHVPHGLELTSSLSSV